MKNAQKLFYEIKKIGANAALVKVIEMQKDWQSSNIFPDPHISISTNKLLKSCKAARSMNLSTFIMPIVLLQKTPTPKHWRGMIQPFDINAWFTSYEHMLIKYARIAELCKANGLIIGSELASMERYIKQWETLIEKTRAIFSGQLIYSSNWDYLHPNPAWKQLDFIGANTYVGFRFGTGKLKKLRKDLLTWSRKHNKALFITEAGYPSRKGALTKPWDHASNKRADPELQKRGYEAFLQTWSKAPTPHAIFFYEWADSQGTKDSGYSPKGKPAEKLLRQWFDTQNSLSFSNS